MTTIADLLALPESKTLEFKRDLSSVRPVLRTLVAFANTAGGTLVVGRTQEGEVVGVGDVLKDEERLANAIADSVRPGHDPGPRNREPRGQSPPCGARSPLEGRVLREGRGAREERLRSAWLHDPTGWT